VSARPQRERSPSFPIDSTPLSINPIIRYLKTIKANDVEESIKLINSVSIYSINKEDRRQN
jgi:hypothetical protein